MLDSTNLRYDRLTRVPNLLNLGINSLRQKTIAIVGCGGLGSAIINLLCRYPIGRLVILDRDLVDETNLGHQLLFTPADALESLPKVVAAEKYISNVNPEIEVVPHFVDLRSTNIDAVLTGCDLVLDGLDNFETRFLLNDWCVKNRIPYIYGGLVEREAITKVIIPQRTSCLRCLIPELPPVGSIRTCDVYGIHLPVITALASVMIDFALTTFRNKDTNEVASFIGKLVSIQFNTNGIHLDEFPASRISNPACRTCNGHYDFLDTKPNTSIVQVCGQNALSMTLGDVVDIKSIVSKLFTLDNKNFEIKTTDYYSRLTDVSTQIAFTLFTHGRILMEGSNDERILRTFVSKYIGM